MCPAHSAEADLLELIVNREEATPAALHEFASVSGRSSTHEERSDDGSFQRHVVRLLSGLSTLTINGRHEAVASPQS